MQIGIIGLGRMGANIARRLMQGGHHPVVYDIDAAARAELGAAGATPAESLEALVGALAAPRAIWVMLPAGRITEGTIAHLAAILAAGDIVIDGGNTYYKDDIRRAATLAANGILYVDVGTSGGVWGLTRGYCMMIGGAAGAVEHLDPIFRTLAPGLGDVPRTPDREAHDPRAELGYIHAGPPGAGHFVKMVHNGIEYGLMQAYAEGFNILAEQERRCAARRRALRAQPRRHRRSVAARLGDLVLAARPQRRGFGARPQPRGVFRLCRGFRRGPLDGRGGDRGGSAGRRAHGLALHPLPLAPDP